MSRVTQLVTRVLRTLPAPRDHNPQIYLALSGGVDSSVAGYLLRERGYEVRPIFLRCWTSDDGACVEQEFRASEKAASHLSLPPPEDWDFVREYWNSVFEPVLLHGLAAGLTPNPDISCNTLVKFGAFPERLRKHTNSDDVLFATGHYARLDRENHLHRATDSAKDQSYFLANVPRTSLRGAMFPIGTLHKAETREIARHVGLPAAHARSSRGLCFVGARRLSELLATYIDENNVKPPRFVDIDTKSVICEASESLWAYTVGQRARIGGVPSPYYVAHKCNRENVILVASGNESPHLHTLVVRTNHPRWIAEQPQLDIPLLAKLSSCSALEPCMVHITDSGLSVHFERHVRRVGAGQLVAFYRDNLCLGGATVAPEPFPFDLSQSQQNASFVQ